MKIALDCNIPLEARIELTKVGHKVVTVAFDGESDEDWMERAFNNGAEVIVSNDSQVAFDAKINGLKVIQPIGNGKEMIKMIISELKDYE